MSRWALRMKSEERDGATRDILQRERKRKDAEDLAEGKGEATM
jgi:hypothetical protein